MKQIWAPWRMEYINKKKSGECIFCSLPKAGDDKNKFYFIYRQLLFYHHEYFSI